MQQEHKIEPLREALLNKLQRANFDISGVLELTSQLARLDPDHVRFSVDAGHLSRLGKELVVKQETAVSELVKNAYDADATVVELSFEETELAGGCLRIEDNGSGMTREQLIDGFMRLSSTDKIRHPISPWYKRRRAGRKGIGRFAAQRLGDKLTIITQSQEADEALRVEIYWKQFEQERELGTIASRVDKIKKTKAHGTTLIIEGLAEGWTDASITRVYRYIADLIQPFPLSKATQNSQIDPGFDSKIYRMSKGEKEELASVEKMIYEHALAEVDGYVDCSGDGFWSIKSTYFNIDEQNLEIGKEREKPETLFIYLKDIRLKAYYYIYDKKYIPGTQKKLIQELAKERGGIRIYRNGFRVLPYGERSDDWLKLDAEPAPREYFAPHGNRHFLGFVELIDQEGKWFEETSSREGLIENEAFKELVDFVSGILRTVARKVLEGRKRKEAEDQKVAGKEKATPTERIKAATQELSQVASALESTVESLPTVPQGGFALNQQEVPRVREIIRAIEEATAEQEEETEARLEEIEMLRVLASLGLTIGEFIHEIRHLLPAIQLDAKQFLHIHREEAEPRKYALRLQENLESFKAYASFFDRAISSNARREMTPQELRRVINSFIEVIKPAAQRYKLKIIDPKIRGYDLFTLPMHPSEWSSILFNLFTNAKKAIDRAGSQGQILIKAGRKGEDLYLEFADNGDGIAPENKARIFDAFFTTSSPASPLANEEENLLGTGLGLKILKDIVTSYKGDIRLVSPPENFSTCFRIELPRATDKELKDYGYY